jgi:hypothetical protein
MKRINKPLRTAVLSDGQPYVDEPVYVEISKAKPLASEIAAMFGRAVSAQIKELSHYHHVRLRWMKPDGRGGLIPRET